MGTVMFYDIRARKYMEQYHISNNAEEPPVKQNVAKLSTSQGYVVSAILFYASMTLFYRNHLFFLAWKLIKLFSCIIQTDPTLSGGDVIYFFFLIAHSLDL